MREQQGCGVRVGRNFVLLVIFFFFFSNHYIKELESGTQEINESNVFGTDSTALENKAVKNKDHKRVRCLNSLMINILTLEITIRAPKEC